jgi:hypothetical protein
MLKRFKTKELVFLALMAALMFVIAVVLGLFLTSITGVPLLGGIIVNWFLAFSLVLIALTIRKFGSLSLSIMIYSLLSVPTINFGPPGIYKVIVGVAMGLIMDSFLYLGKYKKIIYYVGAGFSYLIVPLIMLFAMQLLGMPQASNLLPLIIPMMAIGLVEGLIGCWLAFKVYDKKLKNSKLLKQFAD